MPHGVDAGKGRQIDLEQTGVLGDEIDPTLRGVGQAEARTGCRPGNATGGLVFVNRSGAHIENENMLLADIQKKGNLFFANDVTFSEGRTFFLARNDAG